MWVADADRHAHSTELVAATPAFGREWVDSNLPRFQNWGLGQNLAYLRGERCCIYSHNNSILMAFVNTSRALGSFSVFRPAREHTAFL